MEKLKNGGPAFPVEMTNTSEHAQLGFGSHTIGPGMTAYYTGMTLRDYFAAKAMQAMLSRGAPLDSEQMAMDAYVYADAMLKAGDAP